ncbi:MAG: response regulator [Spirochaetales bacterium]|nr:response regulator [Spirochaetales bacterium]
MRKNIKNNLDAGVSSTDPSIEEIKLRKQLKGLAIVSFIAAFIVTFMYATRPNPLKVVIPNLIFVAMYSGFVLLNKFNQFHITKKFFIYGFVLHIFVMALMGSMDKGDVLYILLALPFMTYLTQKKVIPNSLLGFAVIFMIYSIWIFLPGLREWFIINGTGDLQKLESVKVLWNNLILLFLFTLFTEVMVRAINDYKRRIDNSLQERTQFLINLSHELKTPLTLIENHLSEYINNVKTDSSLQFITNNIKKLQRDVINYLDIEKLERGLYHYNHEQIINISDTLKTKLKLFQPLLTNKDISVACRIEDNIHIKIDPYAIDRVINNLFDNSIKYMDSKGSIDINLKSVNGKVFFSIKDSGCGIPEAQKQIIFNPYQQLVSRKKARQGLGMGLCIVKKILDEVNAEIEIESKIDRGTQFSMFFNRHQLMDDDVVVKEDYSAPIITDARIDFPEVKIDAAKNNIMVVEDNKELLYFLITKLKPYYNVYFAQNGEEAVELLDKIPKPNLIVSDVMMDKMNGYDFFHKLSENKGFGDIPFIFLTARTVISEKINALHEGAIDYIYKPFHFEELLAKITAIIKNQTLQQTFFVKSKFISLGILLAGISHEILNPLNNIYAPLDNIEIIVNRSELPDNKKIRIFIEQIHKNVNRIEMIIKNLRYLLMQNKVEENEILLEDILKAIQKIFQNKIENRIAFYFHIDKNFKLIGNHDIISQILINLISNAINAIKEKGKIVIEGKLNKWGKKMITVKDNGCGILIENRNKIFDPFFSASNSTGLGLFIVRELITRLGWELNWNSEENKGSEFVITIP